MLLALLAADIVLVALLALLLAPLCSRQFIKD